MSKRKFQREMAKTATDGSSYPAIHRALTGETIPSVPFLEHAADLLTVRRAWLAVGDGPMEEPTDFRTTLSASEAFGAFLPVHELQAWHDLVASLDLDDAERTAVHDLATGMFDAMNVFEIGDVTTAGGERVYRPAPEFKEAMRLSLRAWHLFLTQWISECGLKPVRAQLRADMPAVRTRFSQRFSGARERTAAKKRR